MKTGGIKTAARRPSRLNRARARRPLPDAATPGRVADGAATERLGGVRRAAAQGGN